MRVWTHLEPQLAIKRRNPPEGIHATQGIRRDLENRLRSKVLLAIPDDHEMREGTVQDFSTAEQEGNVARQLQDIVVQLQVCAPCANFESVWQSIDTMIPLGLYKFENEMIPYIDDTRAMARPSQCSAPGNIMVREI
ncbi:hypothetical protein R3P38DRAFT_2783767 [Favolaschia claudopus]|uniref:Uncharacterized protein n=1 Tax=Favolaschia claudopus TaxID=2862362 RepID=A0AAW0B012_9AGAR